MMLQKPKIILFFIATLIFFIKAEAAIKQSAGTGNWNSTTTWIGGVIPAPTDSVFIQNNHIVTIPNLSQAITRNAAILGNGQLRILDTMIINVAINISVDSVYNSINVGYLICNQNCTFSGNYFGNEGMIIGMGELIINSGSILELNGDSHIGRGSTTGKLRVHGICNWTGGNISANSNTTGIFTVESTGILNILHTNTPFFYNQNISIFGKLVKQTNTITYFSNTGTGTSALTIKNGGSVEGIGTIHVLTNASTTLTFESGSQIKPKEANTGRLFFMRGNTSAVTNFGSAVYKCQINGLNNNDTLANNGNAVISSMSLDVNFGSFTPTPGQSFVIMTYASKTGSSFASVNIPLPVGSYQLFYGPTNISLYLPLPPPPTNYVFTNAGGNHRWTNPNNWSPNGVPKNTTDTVTIGSITNSADSVFLDTTIQIKRINLFGKLHCIEDLNVSVLNCLGGTGRGEFGLFGDTLYNSNGNIIGNGDIDFGIINCNGGNIRCDQQLTAGGFFSYGGTVLGPNNMSVIGFFHYSGTLNIEKKMNVTGFYNYGGLINGNNKISVLRFAHFHGGSLEGQDTLVTDSLFLYTTAQHEIKKNISAKSTFWYGGDISIDPFKSFKTSTVFTIFFGSIGSPTYKFKHQGGVNSHLGSIKKDCAVGLPIFESPIEVTSVYNYTASQVQFINQAKINGLLLLNTNLSSILFSGNSNLVKSIQGNGSITIRKGELILDSLNGYRFFTGTLTVSDSSILSIPNTIHSSIYPLNFDLNIQGSNLEYNGSQPLDVKKLNIIPFYGTSIFRRSKTQGIGKIMPRIELTVKNAEINSKIETGYSCNTIFNSGTPIGLGKTVINDSLVLNDTVVWEGTNDSILIGPNGKLVDNSYFSNWRADTINLINNGGSFTFNTNVKNVFKIQPTATKIKTQYNLPPINFTKGNYILSEFPQLTNSLTISVGTGYSVQIDKPNFVIDGPFFLYSNSVLNLNHSGSFKNDFQSTNGIGISTGKVQLHNFSGQLRKVSFAKNPVFGELSLIQAVVEIDSGMASVIKYTASASKMTSASSSAKVNIIEKTNSTNDTFDINTEINGQEWRLNGTVVVTPQANVKTTYIDIIPSSGSVTLKGENIDLNGHILLDKSPNSYFYLPDIDSLPADIYGSKKSNLRPTLYLTKNAPKSLTGYIYGEVDIIPTVNYNIKVSKLDPKREGNDFGKIFIYGNVTFSEDAILDLDLKSQTEKDTIAIDGGLVKGNVYLSINETTPPGTYSLITSANNNMTVDPGINFIFDYFTSPSGEVPPNVYIRVKPRALDIEMHPTDHHFVENLTGNWSDPGTWHGNVLPDDTKQVFIPSGATIYVDMIDAIAKRVVVEPGGQLIVLGGKKLTIVED
jgi:hypothetical protein